MISFIILAYLISNQSGSHLMCSIEASTHRAQKAKRMTPSTYPLSLFQYWRSLIRFAKHQPSSSASRECKFNQHNIKHLHIIITHAVYYTRIYIYIISAPLEHWEVERIYEAEILWKIILISSLQQMIVWLPQNSLELIWNDPFRYNFGGKLVRACSFCLILAYYLHVKRDTLLAYN